MKLLILRFKKGPKVSTPHPLKSTDSVSHCVHKIKMTYQKAEQSPGGALKRLVVCHSTCEVYRITLTETEH
ncbi:unnamed protein product [Orchesella dallaii]|uniref:Uncharacterized protein n=1 Tax=Orchesella dallaii TaxID=48710 RepID=A0ABP1R614_9HEXA